MRGAAASVPVPAASFPPPAATGMDPNPVLVHIRPLTDRSDLVCFGGLTNDNAFLWREKKRMLLAVRGNSFAGDETGIVNGLGHSQNVEVARRKIADRVQVDHLAIAEKERVNGTVWRSGEANDLSGTISRECSALISSERSEVCHSFIAVAKRMVGTRLANVGRARSTLGHAGVGCAACASQRTELVHGGVCVKERVSRTVLRLGDAHDLARGIDCVRRAAGAAQRT